MGFDSDEIGMTLKGYCVLVDITGRYIRDDKKGYIDDALPDLFARLEINQSQWLNDLKEFAKQGRKAVGALEKLKDYIKHIKNKIQKDIGKKSVFY